MSDAIENQAGTAETSQEREATVNKIEGAQKPNEELEDVQKKLEKVEKKLAKVNEDDKNKRFKIDELNKDIKAREEREAALLKEIDSLKQQTNNKEKAASEKDKELEAIKSEIASLKEDKEKAKAEALKREEEKRVELLKQAEIISKKQNDPDILRLVENAQDNATRELLLNKLKKEKVDTVKTTAIAGLYNKETRDVNLAKTGIAEIAKLKDSDPELYEDIIEKAQQKVKLANKW
jgi:chromosome segregation ATPase